MIILQCKCWPTFSWLKLLRLIVTTSYMYQLSNWTDFIITWFLLMLPVGIWLITQLVVCFVGLGHVSLYPFVYEFNLTWFLWLSIQWFTLWIDHSLPLKWNGNRLRVFTCLNKPISWGYQMTQLKEVLQLILVFELKFLSALGRKKEKFHRDVDCMWLLVSALTMCCFFVKYLYLMYIQPNEAFKL